MLNSPKNSARKEIAPIASPAPGLAGGEGATDSSALRAEAPFAGDFDLYRPILDEAPEGVALLDGKGDILRASSGFALMTGFEPESLEGRDAMPILGLGIGQLQTLLRRGTWRGKAALKRRDGSRLPVELSLAARGGPDGARTYLAIAVDPERTREEAAELQRLAFYDTLTGLPNRALFQDRLAVALGSARRANRRLALLFLDLDNFKHVNDSLGHHAGDLLLVEVAKRLGSAVRGSDTVCRLGGDEFTVILEEISTSADASIVARKVISALEPPFLVEGREIFMGGSVGIALYPFDGTEISTLVKRADAAMYEAKERGRGQYRFASGSSGSVSDERIRAEADIRTGLEREEFEAWFQPQFSLGDPRGGIGPRIVGAEALARWRTRGGVQPPAGFISVAEETGLIIPLGARMLEESCREARRWADAGRPIPVSVNVSSLQFKRGVVVEQVKAALGASGLDPRLLVLEITESIFARDFADMAMIMLELKSFGVRFSVDDFGTGYSALSYIDRLPVDALKIDRAFVERIRSRFEGVEIATAVVSMARAFGLESVAEGVETEAQLDALRSRGCDIGQGFLLGRPMPAADFLRALLGESPPELDEPLAAG